MAAFKKVFIILAMMGAMIPSFAFADSFGLDNAAKGTALENFKTTNTDIPNLIGTIVGVALSFVGAIFFLLILYAGFLWMTAFGAADKVDKAKSILEHAAVGLIIVLAAYAISKFVFGALTGATSTSAPATQTANMGCCSNSATGGTVQTLQSNCSGATRTWVAGPCP